MTYAIIRGRPVTKGRPRLGRRRRAYTPAKTVAYEQLVAEQWSEQNPEHTPYEGPVALEMVIGSDYVQVEVFELETSSRPKYVTGDIDNYLKSVGDGLNGHAYVDDKQVHMITVFLSKETENEK
jgi:Holliday junction resolvase RusA-like endonuclease